MRRAAALLLTLVLGSAATGRADAQAAAPPRRIVLEAGLGGARHRPTCTDCPGGLYASDMVAGHLALGVTLGSTLSLYLSEDAGSAFDLVDDGGTDGYEYRTAFAELSLRSVPLLALRLGAGQAVGTALGSSLQGSGAAVRAGIALRTPPDHVVALVVAADAFRGLSGRYGPYGGYTSDIRPAFRPFTLQLALGLRAQIPLD